MSIELIKMPDLGKLRSNRDKFLAQLYADGASVSVIARDAGVTERMVYRAIKRYCKNEKAGESDHSHQPTTATSGEIATAASASSVADSPTDAVVNG